MKTEQSMAVAKIAVAISLVILNGYFVDGQQMGDYYHPPVDASSKIDSREVKCLGKSYFLFSLLNNINE